MLSHFARATRILNASGSLSGIEPGNRSIDIIVGDV